MLVCIDAFNVLEWRVKLRYLSKIFGNQAFHSSFVIAIDDIKLFRLLYIVARHDSCRALFTICEQWENNYLVSQLPTIQELL